jgi:hypothetical protein
MSKKPEASSGEPRPCIPASPPSRQPAGEGRGERDASLGMIPLRGNGLVAFSPLASSIPHNRWRLAGGGSEKQEVAVWMREAGSG